jgi:hypothetical protein
MQNDLLASAEAFDAGRLKAIRSGAQVERGLISGFFW